ncbi:MAG TPA: vanadium-dependent haloperoxidase, partial [Thermoanaerobaculia bacterium]
INDWNGIAVTTIVTNAGKPPAVATIDLVYVNVAMYDAVNAIDGRYSVFAVSPATTPTGASEEAAAIAAAYNVLKTFYPGQATFLDGQYAASLVPIPDGDSKSRGVQIGQEVATLYLAQRSTDGRNANITYTPGTGPGAWQPTLPGFQAAQGPWIAQMTPFAINSASQFRADPPPALDSSTWTADYNEVRSLGDINSVTRTPEQTEIGLFYTEHTGKQYDRILCDFAATQNFSLADEARFMAQMLVSIGDALISAWDSKFYYGRWRPVTAIRLVDDPRWIPLAVTPNHPEYPAAHGAFTGALAEGLRQFCGTKDVTITLSSTVTGTTRTFYNTDDLVKEIIVGRIYGGMHFRTSVIEGKVQGTKVAKWVASRCFLPVDLHGRKNAAGAGGYVAKLRGILKD